MEKKNIRKYYIRYVLYYFGYVMVTGGIIQSFMLESGISSAQVSIYTAVIQFVQAAAMLLLGPVLEKQKNIIRINANAGLGLLPVFAAMLAVCLIPGMSTDLKYTLITGASVLAYVALGVLGILEYKLPYRIIRMENYGTVVSIAGMVIGLTSLACSSLLTFFISRYDYFKVMPVFLIIGILLSFAAVKVGKSYEDLMEKEGEPGKKPETGDQPDPEKKTEPEKTGLQDFTSIFSYGPFRKLFIPNLLRGIGSGTFGLLTTIGYYYGIVNASGAAKMTMVMNVIIMSGCLIYSRLAKQNIDGPLVLVSTIVLAVTMPCMLIGRSFAVFMALYAVGALFKNFIDYACPVICTRIVDYEHIGQFSAWRISLYMLGAALAGLITVPMLDHLGGVLTMAVNGLIFLLTGIGYFLVSRGDGSKARDGAE